MQTITLPVIFTALLAAVLGGACSNGDACEQWRQWRNGQTSACTMCLASNCNDAHRQLQNMTSMCGDEFACVARCPANASDTCSCIDGCLVTDACHMAFETYLTCSVDQCDAPCH